MATAKELTVEEKLKLLYKLQNVYTQIDKLRTLQGELPQEVKDMGDEVEGLKTRRSNIEAEISNLQKQISDKRHAIDIANDTIAKYEANHENVHNSREYDAITKEIEYQRYDIELCEKRIREYNESLQQSQTYLENTRLEISEREHELDKKRDELADIMNETKEQMENFISQAQIIEGRIDDYYLNAFKRIRKNAHNGLAVVTISREACGGCFNKIPAQRQLDIRLRKKVIACEYCGRILIDNELATEVNKKSK